MTTAKPRILVVAPQPFFTPRGTPFSVYYRTLISSELGYAADILTYGQGSDVCIDGVRLIRTPAMRWLGAIKTGPSLLKILHDGFILLYMVALLARRRYRIVHAHEEAVFFAALLKPVFRFKLIYDMHSSLPEQLTNFNFSSNRLLIALFERLERLSLRAADAIITICPALEQQVRSMAPWAMTKHELIENSIFEPVRLAAVAGPESALQSDDQLLSQPQIAPALSNLQARPLIVYAGTLEAYQGIDLLVQTALELTKRRVDFRLVIAGGSTRQVEHYREYYRQSCAALPSPGEDNAVCFIGQISPDAARALNRRADIIVSPRSSGNNTPLKVYEQLACGTPLVATSIYSHTQVLSSQVCVLVDPEPEAIANGIDSLLKDPELGRSLVANAREHYQRYYAKPIYTQKLAAVLARAN